MELINQLHKKTAFNLNQEVTKGAAADHYRILWMLRGRLILEPFCKIAGA